MHDDRWYCTSKVLVHQWKSSTFSVLVRKVLWMNETMSHREILRRDRFARELVLYCVLGVLPILAIGLFLLTTQLWDWWFLLIIIVFIPLYATLRFGFFLGLKTWQWVLTALLFVAGYLGSFLFLLYFGYRFARNPPLPEHPHKIEEEPDFADDGAHWFSTTGSHTPVVVPTDGVHNGDEDT